MSVERKAMSRAVRRTESAHRSGSSSSSSPTISLCRRERSLLFALWAMRRTLSLSSGIPIRARSNRTMLTLTPSVTASS